MSPFACSLESFKREVAKFCRRAESGEWTKEQIDLGFKSVALSYLNMEGDEADRTISVGYLEYAMRRCN